jgi:hypothetical protein
MIFFVHNGRAAIRVGRYWMVYSAGNVTNGKRYTSSRAALEDQL